MSIQMITKILVLLIVGLSIILFAKKDDKFKRVVTSKMFKIVAVVVLVVLVLTALSFNVFADEVKVKYVPAVGTELNANDYEVKSRTEEPEVIKEVEENIEKISIPTKIIEASAGEFSKETIGIDFSDTIDFYVNGELLKLWKVVYDKKENKLVPIYYPKNSIEEAIKIDFEHGVDINVMLNRYPSTSEKDILYIITGKYEEHTSSKYLGDINRIVESDWFEGIDYEVLKTRYAIDDNYIKYWLETIPKRKGVPESKINTFLNW